MQPGTLTGAGLVTAAKDGDAGTASVSRFLPMVVGGDGQPIAGIPLVTALTSNVGSGGSGTDDTDDSQKEKRQDVTVPVWVRSETAGTVTVRARVVYGAAQVGEMAAGAEQEGLGGTGSMATEWARAEVLCVRPLAATVDVVQLEVKTRDPKV